jgi:hypothetical protein
VESYVVRALKFDCIDESGIDWLGSDEPYWVFTANVNAAVHSVVSGEFTDVDSGETRRFRPPLTVWPAKGGSAAGPIAVSIQLWEADQGNRDKTRIATEGALTLAAATPAGPWVTAIRPLIANGLVDLVSDDLMGSRTLLWSAARLRRLLPQPGNSFTRKFHFGGNDGDLPFNIAGGPDYDLYLQVARLA